MTSKTTFRPERPISVVFWTVVLVSLQAMACFRGFDPSKLTCSKDEGCPSDHYCSAGICVRGTSPSDGSLDTLPPSPLDSNSERGASADGTDGGATDGGSGFYDARQDGAGGAGGSDGAGAGGEGGSDVPIGPSTGTPCQSAADCGGGYCVDGVCCDSACAGQCQSCKEVGSVGQCKPVKGPPIGGRPACGGTAVCQSQCDGIHGGACTYPDSATVCTAASCTAGKATTASVCNGSGNCTASTTNACDSNLCAADGVSCAGSCTPTSCAAGTYCGSGGACAPKLANGQLCSGSTQCTTGNCVDGVCCDGPCTGQCQTCAATPGTCKSVTTARSSCGGTAPCAGYCDGTGPACAFPGSATTCSPASCQNLTTALAPAVCNGTGACPAATASPCPAGQVCSGAGVCGCPANTCGATCQVCATGQACSGGACVCNASSCPGGCCSGSTCVVVANQTTATCGGGPNGTCKACTNQACVSGACTGTCSPSTSCNDSNECTSPDTCNSSGVCVGTAKAANSPCTGRLYGSCQSGACSCYQSVAPVACTSGQSCMNWGFESGTTEGWGMDPSGSGAGVQNITVSSTRSHTGTGSLAVTMGVGAYSSDGAQSGASVAVPLCPSSGTANFAGYTLSAWVYFTVTSGSIPMYAANLVQAWLADPNTPTRGYFTGSPAVAVNTSNLNQWLHVQGNVNQPSTTNYLVGLSVGFAMADYNSDGFEGTMYIDDLQLLPP